MGDKKGAKRVFHDILPIDITGMTESEIDRAVAVFKKYKQYQEEINDKMGVVNFSKTKSTSNEGASSKKKKKN